MNIYKAINEIMKELAKNPIKKEDVNQNQKYKYRGIEAICNGLSPLFAKHGVVVFPEVLDLRTETRGKMFNTVVKVKYTFVCAEDASKFETIVSGEGADVGDKSINKAHTSAYKNCMNQTFCIPTETHEDPDHTTPELNPENQPATPSQMQKVFTLIAQTEADRQKLAEHLKVDHINNLSFQKAEEAINALTKKLRRANND